MKRFLRAVLGVALTVLICSCTPQNDNAAQPAPDGGARPFRVINYWAIWCAPCREEIPELNELAVGNPSTVIVQGVNYDGVTGEKLREQAAQLGIEFEMLEQDPGLSLGIERPTVLPTTVIVSPDSKVLHILLGPQTREGLESLLEMDS